MLYKLYIITNKDQNVKRKKIKNLLTFKQRYDKLLTEDDKSNKKSIVSL